MKILIIRMWADVLDINKYNCQELGLAKALVKKGNRCDIVLYTDKESYEEDVFFDVDNKKIHIYYLKAHTFLKNVFFEKKIYKIIKDYDIVQTTEYDQIKNVKLKKILKNKLVIYHGPYESNYTRGYRKKCIISDLYYKLHKEYKNTTCIVKSKLAAEFLEKKGFKNVTTIGVGLDIDRFNEDKMNDKNDKEIETLIKDKQENNTKYLLYIGKIEQRRNIRFLIDVLSEVNNEKSNIKLILIGDGEEEYKQKCWKYAQSKKIKDKIIYYKSMQQRDLTNVYKNSEVFLLPTQYEIFGMVLLEAMSFGVPTITTLNGGSSTLIENGKNGFICSLGCPKKWKEIIFEIVDNYDLKNTISNSAKKCINENFLWIRLSEKFIKIYINSINENNYNKNI